MTAVIHPIYGRGLATGKRNGFFIEVVFARDIGISSNREKPNTLWVSARVCS